MITVLAYQAEQQRLEAELSLRVRQIELRRADLNSALDRARQEHNNVMDAVRQARERAVKECYRRIGELAHIREDAINKARAEMEAEQQRYGSSVRKIEDELRSASSEQRRLEAEYAAQIMVIAGCKSEEEKGGAE